MAIYKLFPTKDTTLYSLNPGMNTGLDAILETSNVISVNGSPQISRYLVQFDSTEISNVVSTISQTPGGVFYLKNFIAEAQGLNQNTSLEIRPTAQDWNNGTGFTVWDNTVSTSSNIVGDGASWLYSNYNGSGAWSMSGTINTHPYTGSYVAQYASLGGGNWFSENTYLNTVTFGLRDVKDIESNVTNTVNAWISSSIPNYGFIIKLTGSQEFNPSTSVQPIFKYYSVDTNTIYPPCLEYRWNDYKTVLTGSATASLINTVDLKMSLAENPGEFFPESINRFYINVSPLYPTRTYQTSSLFTNLNYLPTSSYYAIKDLDTNEFVINFDTTYTKISSDANGNYFTIYMSGLEPERYYKVLIKTIINSSTIIFDDNYYFKVING